MTVKIPMMMLQYVVMFTVPTVVGYYYWNPRSNEEIRKDVVRLVCWCDLDL
jgi:hypothetical protein